MLGNVELPLTRVVIPLMRPGTGTAVDSSYVECSMPSNNADATGNGVIEFGMRLSESGLASTARHTKKNQ